MELLKFDYLIIESSFRIVGIGMSLSGEIKKLADISSRGGRVPPIYLYLIFILPGFVFSVDRIGHFNYIPFILVSITIIPLIAATNLFDDYFDYVKGVDKADSPNTHYRHHPIFHYGVTERYLIEWAVVFSAIYLLMSFILSLRYGLILNLIAAIGLLLGYGYTGPPIGYKYLGTGEIGIFFSTIAAGEYVSFAAAGRFYISSLPFLVPFSLIIALLLFIGNYRDLESDQRSGFKTLAVSLGKKRSEFFSISVFTLFYGAIVLLSVLKVYGVLSLIDLATAPFAYYLSIMWSRRDSSGFEKFAGPYLFGILMLLIILLIL
ncbi:MAG: prenyltransferase [Thermoplasmatales archaeon]|nr:prenyltransferase [Thermoplasmatales archaeon]